MSARARGIFITGTDTGVGKTVVGAALALALRQRGMRVGVMKPVESGCRRRDGGLIPEDALLLRAAAGDEVPLASVNLHALEAPLAPALAAEIEGVAISMEAIVGAYQGLAEAHDVVLVEGAGGLLAPLWKELRMADLAVALGLEALVVARNALGAINHADLTVRAARAASLAVVGVVLNNPSPSLGPGPRTNAHSLRRWVRAPFLGELPHVPGLDFESLRRAAEASLDLGALLRSQAARLDRRR